MDNRLFFVIFAVMVVFSIGVVRNKPFLINIESIDKMVIEENKEEQRLTAKIELLLLLSKAKWYRDFYETTMYGPNNCGKKSSDPLYRITASGKKVREDITAAASPGIPFGTLVMISGLEKNVYIIQDRGGKIKKGKGKWPKLDKIDVFVEDETVALKFGREKKIAYLLYPDNQTPEIRQALQKYLKYF